MNFHKLSTTIFIFWAFLIAYPVHVDVWKYSFEINRVEQLGPFLSGSRTRGQPYTPTGTTYKNHKMTPLDDYVSRPDSTYYWQELKTVLEVHEITKFYETPFANIYYINLTSQKWLDETKVDTPIWTHYLCVVVPQIIDQPDFAFLYISGGSKGGIPSEQTTELLFAMTIAGVNHAITGVLFEVPNEPLQFWDEKPQPKLRSEDAAISYTWMHQLNNTTNEDYPLRLPMVKSAIRAMDAIEEYIFKKLGNKIERWNIGGQSKRGWTTWNTGAYDSVHEERVVSIIPMVMSFMNFNIQMHHWWKAMGGWSVALSDYYNDNFTASFDSVNLDKLAWIEDPYTYRERYKNMVLYEIIAANDEFFMFNDPRYYWDDLHFKEKFLLVIPNIGHSMKNDPKTLITAVSSFLRSIMLKLDRPRIEFFINNEKGEILFLCSEKPNDTSIWHADTINNKRIDWRWYTLDDPCPSKIIEHGMCRQFVIFYMKSPEKINDFEYKAQFEPPKEGKWKGFFILASFDKQIDILGFPFLFSSYAAIIPDKFPFNDCSGSACRGKLI